MEQAYAGQKKKILYILAPDHRLSSERRTRITALDVTLLGMAVLIILYWYVACITLYLFKVPF